MSVSRPFHGVIPAMAIPFREDYRIDEEGLAEASGVSRVELV
jgi:dihydrodipicolinate synthase/N-acetylneuraminate lyase